MISKKAERQATLISDEAKNLRIIYLVSFLYLVKLLKHKLDLCDRNRIFRFLCDEFEMTARGIENILQNGTKNNVKIGAQIETWVTRFKKSDRMTERLDQSLTYLVSSNLFHSKTLVSTLSDRSQTKFLYLNLIELLESRELQRILKEISPESLEFWNSILNITPLKLHSMVEVVAHPISRKIEYLDVSNMKIKVACEALHKKHFASSNPYSFRRMMELIASAQSPRQDPGRLYRDLKFGNQKITTVMKNFEDSLGRIS